MPKHLLPKFGSVSSKSFLSEQASSVRLLDCPGRVQGLRVSYGRNRGSVFGPQWTGEATSLGKRIFYISHAMYWLGARDLIRVRGSLAPTMVEGRLAGIRRDHDRFVSIAAEIELEPRVDNAKAPYRLKRLNSRLPDSLRVQVPENHVLAQDLYYSYYYPKLKYLIIGYLDP